MVSIECVQHAVNVRDGAGTNYPASSVLTQGQQAVADSFGYGMWLHITAPHIGYVYAGSQTVPNVELLDVTIPVPDGAAKVKTTAALNVRTGPGTNYDILFTLNQNQVVVIDPTKTINGWYHIAGTTAQWISSTYTTPVDGSVPAPVPPPIPVPLPPQSLPWVLPFGASQRGAHLNAGGWSPGPQELALIKINNIQTVLAVAYNTNVAGIAVPALRANGVQNIIVRASTTEAISTVQRFLDLTVPVLKEYAAALGTTAMIIAIHNEPNLISEGYGKGWADGAGFAAWWAQVAQTYRTTFPGCKLGYPATSPGTGVNGVRADERTFAQQSIAAIRAADWIGLHAYWAKQDGSDFAPEITYWKQFGKPIIGTEIGPVSNAVVKPETVQHAYDVLGAAGIPACAWILDGSGMFNGASWTVNNLRL